MTELYLFIHITSAALAGFYFVRNGRLTGTHERLIMAVICAVLGPSMLALAGLSAMSEASKDKAHNGRRGGE